PGLLDPPPLLIVIGPVIFAEPAGHPQPARGGPWPMSHPQERIHKNVEPLLRTDAGEITDGVRLAWRARGGAAVATQVQAGVDDVGALGRQTEQLAHVSGVIAAGGHEAVNFAAVVADQVERPAA